MRALAATLFLLPLAGCGYHIAGKADLIPKRVQTIAIPAFGNATTKYKLSENLTTSITREFISRTRYRIVTNPDEADAVLTGSVVNFFSYPTIFDPVTGRASGVQVVVVLQVTLTDRSTKAVLFTRPNFEVRERYEISVDPRAYFEESDSALERVSHDVARAVVSGILENF
jgi:outer membrane lipopolysaccharide assembly protein LptE/RlpB